MRIDVLNKFNEQGRSYWIESEDLDEDMIAKIKETLRDPVDQYILFDERLPRERSLIEVSHKPGVTDNSARALENLFKHTLPKVSLKIATGKLYFENHLLSLKDLEKKAQAYFNPLIERVQIHQPHKYQDFVPSPVFPEVKLEQKPVNYFDLEELTLSELADLSTKNLWALSDDELSHIKAHFEHSDIIAQRKALGLSRLVSDIELEILAQTWSEHCKHKIFSAEINYQGNDNKVPNHTVNSIFKSHIKEVTKKIDKDWLVSVFVDNAGIVRFGEKNDFCLKVETHNSPSALDPYGGAITGILGVNRDILGCGIGAEPIANTNVLCFGSQRYTEDELSHLPAKLKSPNEILRGVQKGIEDGGNKSGIPTVNGAFNFQDNYSGKPLVYCGTVGVIPQQINGQATSEKRHKPGDYIVICGGSVGADGIHGATFSSLEMDENSPSTAVQIGDPFTQKKVTDFLLKARDLGLYNSLTDNGAGGLSSSVGEMAEHTNGASINLEKIPLKYPGLAPYEIVISESQERMTFSVPKEKLTEFTELAIVYDVNPAVIGNFHDRGSFDIYQDAKLLASLDLHFLHNSLPQMKLNAYFEGPKAEKTWFEKSQSDEKTLEDRVYQLIGHENIKSKHQWVKQFDHEVKASTASKPFIDKKSLGPTDAAVLLTENYGEKDDSGLSIGCGLAPHFSHIDTYFMTQMAIDEAIRNLISVGTDPNFIALCDNYCWPDPIKSKRNPDGDHKLAQLVRSTYALKETAEVYQTPFISGKDSMKNDFIGEHPNGEYCKISVPPTLLITGIGKVPHVSKMVSTDFKSDGDLIYCIGQRDFDQSYKSSANPTSMDIPEFDAHQNWKKHLLVSELIKEGLLKSCHDISEGGMITTLIESCFPNKLSFKINNFLKNSESLEALLFNELPASYIVSIPPAAKSRFEHMTKGHSFFLGIIAANETLEIEGLNLNRENLYHNWSCHD